MKQKWAEAYTRDQNVLGTPTGRISARPYPGGQRIGRLNPLVNATFAQQTMVRPVELVTWSEDNDNPDAAGAKVSADIVTPSTRLRCGVQLFVRRSSGIITDLPIGVGGVPCIASLYAMGVDPHSGQRSQMQVIDTFNIPHVTTIDPSYRQVRLIIDVDVDNWVYDTTLFTGGTLILVPNWEPVVDMSQDELNRLLASCSCTPNGSVHRFI